jgi:signal transduction histidine kinase
MSIEQLRATPLFAGLPEEHLERLAEMSEPMHLRPGDLLLEEGSPGDALFVVVSGELDVTKRADGSELPVARIGPGSLQGEMAALEGGVRTASVRAVSEAEVLRIPNEALRALLESGPDVALAIIRTVVGRLRSTEATLRQREKLAALGTLAAGLAHELNNPAAAIRRSVGGLGEAMALRGRAAAALSADSPRLARLVSARPAHGAPTDPLEHGDRIEEVADLLRALGAAEPDAMAGDLVNAGWTGEELRTALGGYGAAEIEPALAWLASVTSADALLGEVSMAAERIGEIVGAVKDYAYLDQAPVQRIDVREGLDNTLVILRHKLKGGVSVKRDYDDRLPQIEAFGSELNQVWTNLIDNAVQAMDGGGELRIRAELAGEGVRVAICDSGPGISDEALPRLFEPFFTTKPPGIGSGLGLHISHNVVARHGGRIEVTTRPGETCFTVTLPTQLPAR